MRNRTSLFTPMDLLLWMITAVVAYLACGDALTIYHAIGAVVILSGIVLTQVSRRQANQRPMLTAEDAENS